MPDLLITGAVALAAAVLALVGLQKRGEIEAVFSLPTAQTLRAVCCVVVILVHIPLAFGNKAQDAIGSFAFICVTLFFLLSAYGLTTQYRQKGEAYIKHFWRNRLASLLIPMALINVAGVLLGNHPQRSVLLRLLWPNDYALTLLLYYVVFWLVHRVKRLTDDARDWILIGFTLATSLAVQGYVAYSGTQASLWPVERLGFAYGILAARFAGGTTERKLAQNGKKWLLWALCAFAVFCGLGLLYLRFKFSGVWLAYALKAVLGTAAILLITILLTRYRLGNKASITAGETSYEIYLAHGAAILFLERALPQLSSGAFILCVLGLTAALAIAVKLLASPLVKLVRKK